MTRDPSNPVRYEKGKWWWYDEVWADRYGPYDTEEAAKAGLVEYSKWLESLPRQEVLP